MVKKAKEEENQEEQEDAVDETSDPEPRVVSNLNIHQRINAVKAEVHYVKKNKVIKNKKGEVMFTVTGHDDVTGIIHPLLVKHGINIIPTFISLVPQVLKVDYYGKEQIVNRERLDVKFTWINIDDPTDFMEQLWTAYGCDDSDKGPGKAISYAQRYAILKTLHLETGEQDLEDTIPKHIREGQELRDAKDQADLDKSIKALKEQTKNQDLPLPDGSQISDGSTLSSELQIMVKKAFITKKMGTEDQKVILDGFMVDGIEEILNSDYEAVIKSIRGA